MSNISCSLKIAKTKLFLENKYKYSVINIEKYAAQSCGEALNGQGDESAGQVDVLLDETGSQRTDKSSALASI